MGQITITIPVAREINYSIESVHDCETLIDLLESFRANKNPSNEDAEDIHEARKALKNGEFIPWETVKAQLNL